jgi:nucleoid-associated protein YgaU
VPSDQSVDGKTAEPEQADKSNAPPANPSDAAPSPATMPSAAPGASASDTPASATPTASTSGGADWNKLLAEGSSTPTMMSETPSVQAKKPDAQTDSASNAPQNASADQSAAPAAPDNAQALAAAADKSAPDLAIDTSGDKIGTPATQPAGSEQRTHIVQPGEMLSTIAAATYGSSRKWKLIAEANPGINPNRLAPGTKLVIPAAPTVSGAPDEASAVTASATIDSRTQYEVQPNDSLYRISMKLYGKADHVNKLYDDNKDVIGSDPRRLNVHMVLKLIDPPTSDAGAGAR